MKINGKELALEGRVTIGELLETQGFDPLKVAVMKNGEIVPRARYGEETAGGDDSLEVVSFVGGG